MENIEIMIGLVLGIVTLIGVFGKLVFDYATLKANTSQILKEILEIKIYFSEHSDRIEELEKRVTVIETQHAMNHSNERMMG